MGTPVKRRVGRRIGATVGVVGTAFGLAGTFLVLSQTYRTQEAISVRHLETLAQAVEASFVVFDARTGQHPIQEIAAQLGNAKRVERVDVLDRHGRVRWSSEPRRRGRLAGAAALEVLTTTVSATHVEPEALETVRALRRRAACLPCHAKSADPIGAVSIVAERRALLGDLLTNTTQAAIVVVLVSLILTALLIGILHRTVVSRLNALVDVMTAAEEGDYMVRATVRADDEIGLLTRTFNRMIAKITDLRVEHIEQEREIVEVKDELSLKERLAQKSEQLEAANRGLSARITELSFLNRLARDLATKLDTDFTLARFCEDVTEQLPVPEVAVLMFDADTERVRALKWHGFEGERGVTDRPIDLSAGITGEVVRTRAPIYVPDTRADPRALAYRSDADPEGTLFCVPMTYQEGVIGVLAFSSPRVDAFTATDRELLITIANQASLALANAQLFQETLELSIRDGLTGILNRRALDERFELEWSRARRDGAPLSVVMLDIDHFKHYNDEHGHQAGDDVLRRVAQLLENSLRKVDAVARYGGEEFCVILPRANKEEAEQVAKKLRRTIAEADFWRGYLQPLGRVTISCGVATTPDDTDVREDLIGLADDALYGAKEAGRNRVFAIRDGRPEPV